MARDTFQGYSAKAGFVKVGILREKEGTTFVVTDTAGARLEKFHSLKHGQSARKDFRDHGETQLEFLRVKSERYYRRRTK